MVAGVRRRGSLLSLRGETSGRLVVWLVAAGASFACGCKSDPAEYSPKERDASSMLDARSDAEDAHIDEYDARVMTDDSRVIDVDARVPSSDAGDAGSVGDILVPTPLISRGKRVTASADVAAPAAVIDGVYCAFPAWNTHTFPSWVAIEIGRGPSRLLLSWNNTFTHDYVNDGERARGAAVSYVIETSGDSTNGADGTWSTVAAVTSNRFRTRAHAFEFGGSSWVRMLVTAGHRDEIDIDEIDVHDASNGTQDAVIFVGASDTAGAFDRCNNTAPSYATLVHEAAPQYFPALINAGIAGASSDFGAANIADFIALNEPYTVWGIGHGGGDARRNIVPATYRANMRAIVESLRAAGKVPVISTIPYASAGPDSGGPNDAHVRALNAEIESLTTELGLLRGPDLYSWFYAHPEELEPDGVHPSLTGSQSMNRLWFESLRPLYGL